MNKIKSFLNEKLVPITDKVTNNKYVKILMDGFMGISALTIGASKRYKKKSFAWYKRVIESNGESLY